MRQPQCFFSWRFEKKKKSSTRDVCVCVCVSMSRTNRGTRGAGVSITCRLCETFGAGISPPAPATPKRYAAGQGHCRSDADGISADVISAQARCRSISPRPGTSPVYRLTRVVAPLSFPGVVLLPRGGAAPVRPWLCVRARASCDAGRRVQTCRRTA